MMVSVVTDCQLTCYRHNVIILVRIHTKELINLVVSFFTLAGPDEEEIPHQALTMHKL